MNLGSQVVEEVLAEDQLRDLGILLAVTTTLILNAYTDKPLTKKQALLFIQRVTYTNGE